MVPVDVPVSEERTPYLLSTSTSRATSKGSLKAKPTALSAFALAYGTTDNPVDPTPENFEKWLDNAYPKDKYGNSIRHQIDCTAKEHKQWVDDLVAGLICPLAAKAFDPW